MVTRQNERFFPRTLIRHEVIYKTDIKLHMGRNLPFADFTEIVLQPKDFCENPIFMPDSKTQDRR